MQPKSDTASSTHLVAYGQTQPEVLARLEQELKLFDAHLQTRQNDWAQVQAGREWTVAQEAEHVMLINISITRLLKLLASDRPLQAAPQTAGVLKDGKRQAPAYSLPSKQGVAWEELELSTEQADTEQADTNIPSRWTEQQQALLDTVTITTANPERTFWHPFFGELDALNWARMVSGHLHSHRHNLEKSDPKLNAPELNVKPN